MMYSVTFFIQITSHPYQDYSQITSKSTEMSSYPEDTTNWPDDTFIFSPCENINPILHTDEEVKGQSIWESKGYTNFEADTTLVNDFRKLGVLSDITCISLADVPNSTLPLAVAYTSGVMEARGTNTNGHRASLPAVAESSSRSVSRTALSSFAWESTELGPAADAPARVPHIELCGEKQTGQATGGLQVAAVNSNLEGRDIEGEEYTSTPTRPGGEPNSRCPKRQAGDRSRFRPWGYI